MLLFRFQFFLKIFTSSETTPKNTCVFQHVHELTTHFYPERKKENPAATSCSLTRAPYEMPLGNLKLKRLFSTFLLRPWSSRQHFYVDVVVVAAAAPSIPFPIYLLPPFTFPFCAKQYKQKMLFSSRPLDWNFTSWITVFFLLLFLSCVGCLFLVRNFLFLYLLSRDSLNSAAAFFPPLCVYFN